MIADPNAAAIDRTLHSGMVRYLHARHEPGQSFVLQYFIRFQSVDRICRINRLRIDTYPIRRTAISSYTAALRMNIPTGPYWRNVDNIPIRWLTGSAVPAQRTHRDGFSLMGELACTEDRDPQWVRNGTPVQYDINGAYKNPNELLVFGENHDVNRMYEMLGRNPESKMAYTFLATTKASPDLLRD